MSNTTGTGGTFGLDGALGVLEGFSGASTNPLHLAAIEAAQEGVCQCVIGSFPTTSRNPLHLAAIEAAQEGFGPLVNHTARWMENNYRSVFTVLVQHLNSKMPRSRDLCVVEDHVQKLITRLVEKDQLAPLLSRGENPKMSVLRVWAYQSAVTELRRWGTDASLRASRAVKTTRQVEQGKSWKVVQAATTAREVVREDEGTTDLYDPNIESPEETMGRKSRVDTVRKALTRAGRTDLVPVMEGLLEGQSMTELRVVFGPVTDQLGSVLKALRV